MSKLHTVTYTVDVTQIIRGNDTGFLKTEYPQIVAEKLKSKMEFDKVDIRDVKVFEHDD